jgi:hypothetical protein
METRMPSTNAHDGPSDEALRVFIYDHLVQRGLPPSSNEIAAHFGGRPEEARAQLGALKIGKTVLVSPRTGEIWMAGPFAAAPSPYALSDGATKWWANCAWDMFGVAIIMGRRLLAETTCPDCGDEVVIECDPDHPPIESSDVVHFLLPARRWYDDIGFT